MAGFLDYFNPNKSALGNILKKLDDLARFGMKFDDMIIRNSQAIGKSESAFAGKGGTGLVADDAFAWTLSHQDTKVKKYIAYFDKGYGEKREFIRKFSMNGEIESILDIITDESIVYNDRNIFAQPIFSKVDLKDSIKEKININYNRIYSIMGFQNSVLAWQYYKQYLIDGFLAFEIIYNDKGTEIIGFKELDPASLQPSTEKISENEFRQFWIQYPNKPQITRKLTNEQIIYISYAKGNSISRISYAERLVRSFNVLKIMENTRIIWNVMNASYRLKFIIPIGTQSPQKALTSLGQLMSNYKEDIQINDASGELTVNGRPKLQFYKNYLFPEKDGISPQIESLNTSGPDFNIMDSVLYFFNKLKMDSKIPSARFSSRGGSPVNYQIQIDQLQRDEIRFEKFLSRMRSAFKEILIKPLYIQMCLDFPELSRDRSFKAGLGLNFNTDTEFAEQLEMGHLKKRSDFITSISEMKAKEDGEEINYFDKDFLVKKYLGLTPDKFKLNIEYKKNESKKEESDKKDKGTDKDGKSDGDEGDEVTL